MLGCYQSPGRSPTVSTTYGPRRQFAPPADFRNGFLLSSFPRLHGNELFYLAASTPKEALADVDVAAVTSGGGLACTDAAEHALLCKLVLYWCSKVESIILTILLWIFCFIWHFVGLAAQTFTVRIHHVTHENASLIPRGRQTTMKFITIKS